MDTSGITLLGLGPGNIKHLTLEAWELLEGAEEIYLRTRQHPVVEALPAHLKIHSFDHLYQKNATFESVYDEIIESVLELGSRPGGVIYAVPGHPMIAEATCPLILQRSREAGIPVRAVDGLSFIEPVFTLLGVDPLPHTAFVDALDLASAHVPPFPPSAPALIAQIHSSAVASEVKLTLMALYPDEHPVILVHGAGTPEEKREEIPLYAIDRSPHVGLLTALYLPPINASASFEAFQEIVAHLRAPDGCLWDREQTHQSLRPYLLEEAYEAVAALDAGDADAMQEEFGDLLLQVVLHAQIASEYGDFNISHILQGIHTKLVNRHPHVFGDLQLKEVDGILRNWEKLKAEERAANGQVESSLLNGVPLALPALAQADQYQTRASRVRFDWVDLQGVFDKVEEELREVKASQDGEERSRELGDLLFTIVNLARWYGVDAETALREANARFRSRFATMEKISRAAGRTLSDHSMEELDTLWQQAKHMGGSSSDVE